MPLHTAELPRSTVRVWSEGVGASLLFLHGFERHPGEAPFLKRLADIRRVIAPEHPGYGESTGFEHLRDIVDLVLHYRAFVEQVCGEPVDVVGHCLGGMFAAEFAALCPHLVRRLVLVGPYGLWSDDDPLPDPFAMEPEAFKRAKWAGNEPASPEPTIAIPNPDEPNAVVYDRARNLSVATKFMWPIPDRGLRRRLPFVQAPTLVVAGASDGLVTPAYADEFARLIPNATVATIAGAGHFPMLDHEDEFSELVLGFLRS